MLPFVIAGLIAFACFVPFIYLSVVMAWMELQTTGTAYYGKSRHERRHFRRALQMHGQILRPVLYLLNRLSPFRFENASFKVRELAGPKSTCTPQSFQRAFEYQPSSNDVFVVTHMQCGTTWMQQLVLLVLHRGQDCLAEDGTSLNAVSPWLEAKSSVSVHDAPTMGPINQRVIKTHLPFSHVPFRSHAKYIYIVQDPVSCYASWVDFLGTHLQSRLPAAATIEAWFTSSLEMWWGSWPEHVSGWWQQAQQNSNILLVRWEDMQSNLTAVVQQVNAFLNLPSLANEELAMILRHASLEHMQANEDLFEITPPHLLQNTTSLLKRDTADRMQDVGTDQRRRIQQWAEKQLLRNGVPGDQLFGSDSAAHVPESAPADVAVSLVNA